MEASYIQFPTDTPHEQSIPPRHATHTRHAPHHESSQERKATTHNTEYKKHFIKMHASTATTFNFAHAACSGRKGSFSKGSNSLRRQATRITTTRAARRADALQCDAKLGIVGGSNLTHSQLFSHLEKKAVSTEHGDVYIWDSQPEDDKQIAFVRRHYCGVDDEEGCVALFLFLFVCLSLAPHTQREPILFPAHCLFLQGVSRRVVEGRPCLATLSHGPGAVQFHCTVECSRPACVGEPYIRNRRLPPRSKALTLSDWQPQ